MKRVPLSLLAIAALASPLVHAANDSPHFGHDSQLSGVDWKQVYNQIFYWNIGKYTPNNPSYTPETIAEHSIYYSPNGFNTTFNFIEGKNADGSYSVTSSAQYPARRDAALDFLNLDAKPANGCYLMEGNAKYRGDQSLRAIEATNTDAKTIAEAIWKTRGDKQQFTDNYFNTSEGTLASRQLSDTVLIVIPGFGSHTIPDYTYPEIVEEANRIHGRVFTGADGKPSTVRHVEEQTDSSGAKVPKYAPGQSPGEFYGSGPEFTNANGEKLGFDIIQPMGREQGNTMGSDDDVADHLAKFVRCEDGQDPKTCLPASYNNKKLIFIGYSKGCPVAHNMVARYPDIQARTLAIVTIAGVNQGALPAESGFRQLVQLTHSKTPPEAMAKVNAGQVSLPPELAAMIALGNGQDAVKQLLASKSVSPQQVIAAANNSQSVAQLKQALAGVYDMSQYRRIKWSLVHLNDKVFTHKINLFNLSVITNRQDFAAPGGLSNEGRTVPPSFFPQFDLGKSDPAANWKVLSKDNQFLISTSLTGFFSAPAGLFDTQVAWVDTKNLALDDRSIWDVLYYPADPNSATPDQEAYQERASLREIQSLTTEVNAERAQLGLAPLPAGYEKMPRRELIAKLGSMKNLNVVDLGDLRGTHWDTAFREVYKPKPDEETNYYTHTFPRKAMLSALIETMAIYKSGLTDSDSAKETSRVQP